MSYLIDSVLFTVLSIYILSIYSLISYRVGWVLVLPSLVFDCCTPYVSAEADAIAI